MLKFFQRRRDRRRMEQMMERFNDKTLYDESRPCHIHFKDNWHCTRGFHAEGPCALVPTTNKNQTNNDGYPLCLNKHCRGNY